MNGASDRNVSGPWGEDFEEYMSFIGARPSRGFNGLNYVYRCPWCRKDGHLYVLVSVPDWSDRQPGSWLCYRCEQRGIGRSGFWKLYCQFEGIDPIEARTQQASIQFRNPLARIHAGDTELVPDTAEQAPLRTRDIWDGTGYDMPRYLTRRGVAVEQCRRYRLRWCADQCGRWNYRIIFPIVDPNDSSRSGFTGRSMLDDAALRPRWETSSGAGRMVFGWNEAGLLDRSSVDLLVLVEGPFDALACDRSGFRAVSMLGKELRGDLIDALLKRRPGKVVLMLDPDAIGVALKKGLDSRLEQFDFRIAALDGNDPADSTSQQIRRCVREAKPVEQAVRYWALDRARAHLRRARIY